MSRKRHRHRRSRRQSRRSRLRHPMRNLPRMKSCTPSSSSRPLSWLDSGG